MIHAHQPKQAIIMRDRIGRRPYNVQKTINDNVDIAIAIMANVPNDNVNLSTWGEYTSSDCGEHDEHVALKHANALRSTEAHCGTHACLFGHIAASGLAPGVWLSWANRATTCRGAEATNLETLGDDAETTTKFCIELDAEQNAAMQPHRLTNHALICIGLFGELGGLWRQRGSCDVDQLLRLEIGNDAYDSVTEQELSIVRLLSITSDGSLKQLLYFARVYISDPPHLPEYARMMWLPREFHGAQLLPGGRV